MSASARPEAEVEPEHAPEQVPEPEPEPGPEVVQEAVPQLSATTRQKRRLPGETPGRERRLSILHNLTSTVAAVQGEDGAVIPESLDQHNEGRAQLIRKVGPNDRSGESLWKGLTDTIMDTHTRKWLGIAAVDGDTEITRRRKRMEQRRQQRDEYIAAHPLILRPDGRFTRTWDQIQILLLLYLAVVVPYRIGFNENTTPGDILFVVDVAVDFYFIVDTITGFFRAYYDEDGMLQYRPMRKLALRYGCSGWFVIDFVSCLPVNYVHFLVPGADSKGTPESVDGAYRANKVLRLLRLFRLLRLLRLTRLQRIIERHEEEVQQYADVIRMLRTGVFILWVTHVVACVWYFAGNETTDEVNPDGTVVQGWVAELYGDAAAAGNANGTAPNHYIASLYYAAMTMTTVGYGDITPNTTAERMTSVVSMMLGGYIFGIVVGIMSEITRNASFGESYKDMELGKVISLLRANDVPPSVSKRIRTFLTQHYLRHSAVDVAEILGLLPESLRDDLASHLNPPWVTSKVLADEEDNEDPHTVHHGHGPRESMLQHVPFFCDLDNLSLILICSRMKMQIFAAAKPLVDQGIEPVHVSPGYSFAQKWDHYITEEGTYGNEMMVVTDGVVGVEYQGKCLGQLKKGDFFCENAALRVYSARGQLRTRSHYAVTKTTLAILSSDDLNHLRKTRQQIDLQLRPFMRQAMAAYYGDAFINIGNSKARDTTEPAAAAPSDSPIPALDTIMDSSGELSSSEDYESPPRDVADSPQRSESGGSKSEGAVEIGTRKLKDLKANPADIATILRQKEGTPAHGLRPAERLYQHAREKAREEEQRVGLQQLASAAADADNGDENPSPLIAVDSVAAAVRAAVRDEMGVFDARLRRIELMLESIAPQQTPQELQTAPDQSGGDTKLAAGP